MSFTTNGDFSTTTTNWSSRRLGQTKGVDIKTIQQQKHIEKGPTLKTTTKFQIKETPPTPPPHNNSSNKHLKQQQQTCSTTIYKQRQSPQFIKGTKAGIGVFGDRRYLNNNKQQNIEFNEEQQRFNSSNGFYDNVHQKHQVEKIF